MRSRRCCVDMTPRPQGTTPHGRRPRRHSRRSAFARPLFQRSPKGAGQRALCMLPLLPRRRPIDCGTLIDPLSKLDLAAPTAGASAGVPQIWHAARHGIVLREQVGRIGLS
ncbi:hypothetical protein CALVIDRAFT_397706 [Calocera viscosa TUFC12733]|uniref:Uncharacterized protein n=1 Tax=Calocera viscosa (strain TUFC12733) TaxID=1330018 RepID=A0A167PRW9_CALVF|nr:hypothetical protein CALVIDRAFT_397706 [Calocera viscosa TUFC12733]